MVLATVIVSDPEIAMSDEKELKDCAQILLFKLQEE
jgi:hypothetical protein